MNARTFGLIVLSFAVLPALAAAQAPPASKPQPAQPAAPLQTSRCAEPAPPATTGQRDAEVPKPDGSNLTEKLAQSNGVLCPPDHGDQAIQAPTPPGGRMPVIKPPGTPGSSDQSVNPK
ncbi:MAG TPA: hypothetical protein VIV09_15350 [Pseudolabrys sp.]|jgi:hypothetical protein